MQHEYWHKIDNGERVWHILFYNASIYMITNVKNGKKYIGCTTQDVYERFRQHMWSIKRRDHANITDYDGEFVVETLVSNIPQPSAYMVEKALMIAYRTYDPAIGYNNRDKYKFPKAAR